MQIKYNIINKPTYWNTFIEQIFYSLPGFLVFPVLIYFLCFAILILKCVKLGLTVFHIFDEYQPVSNKIEIEYCIENILYRRPNSLNVFFNVSSHVHPL